MGRLTTIIVLFVGSIIMCSGGGDACSVREYNDVFIEELKINGIRISNDHFAIDTRSPRFSYVVRTKDHTLRQLSQFAFRIVVDDIASGVRMMDSAKQLSDKTTHHEYSGIHLKSDTSYSVRVDVWVCNATSTPYSVEGSFRTALFDPSDWQGIWIGHEQITMNQLRKEFHVSSVNAPVFAHVAGIGYHELWLNGQKVDETRQLDPGWTSYEDRVLYSSYNVTTLLRTNSTNCIGVMLGNGWYSQEQYITPSFQEPSYGPPRLLLQMGDLLKSDETFSGRRGPILHDSVYNGEIFDANRVRSGWSKSGFQDPYSLWINAIEMKPPGGKLVAQPMEPIRILREIKPKNIWDANLNEGVVDFGQNFAGFARITFKVPRGLSIRIKYAEVLEHPNTGIFSNQVYQDNLRGAAATDVYISRGDVNGETYQPRFTYHGFRYLQVIGCPRGGNLSIVGLQIGTAVKPTLHFNSSNPVINQIQHNIVWGQQSNLMGVASDCPQRDERKGWLGDASLTVDECLFNYDGNAFYTNFLNVITDSQTANGQIGDTAPFTFGGYPADPNWGSALPTITYQHYQHFGDLSVVSSNYDSIKKWITFLSDSVKSSGMANFYFHYGDWVPAGEKVNSSLCSGAAFLGGVSQMIEMAGWLGNNDDVAYFQELYNVSAAEFHDAFWNESVQGYAKGEQSANALALYHPNVVPDHLVDTVVASLVANIEAHDYHLTTGILGVQAIFPVLSKYGKTTVGVKLASQVTYPSFGYMFTNEWENATTLWEIWDAPTQGGGMNSRNHIMFGSIGSWFYRDLLGINPQSDGSVTIRPRVELQVQQLLSFVEGTWRDIVEVKWSLNENVWIMDVNISGSMRATVTLPKLTRNGKWVSLHHNNMIVAEDSYAISVHSGTHHFVGHWSESVK